jgi:putative ABC transport system ATP-binding protein
MHILGALDVPSSGTYSIDGKDISKFTQDELADLRKNSIGFVFQSFNLLKRTTLVRNVMIPLIYAEVSKKEREQKAKDALGMVEIDESHFYHHPNEISGGQMQRVAIARALINNPSLILADEPTGNLDTHTGDVVLQTFQKLNKKENKTIVLITHERYVAEHADRIITIVDGGLVGDTTSFSKRTARPIHAV